MATAGDVNDEGPIVGLHEDSGGLSAGGVVGGRAAAVGTLHTAARRLLHPLLTVVALLPRVGQARPRGPVSHSGPEWSTSCWSLSVLAINA